MKSEVGSRNSELGSRNSELGSRKLEVGTKKSEIRSPYPAFVLKRVSLHHRNRFKQINKNKSSIIIRANQLA